MNRKYIIIAIIGLTIFLALVASGLAVGISLLKRGTTVPTPPPSEETIPPVATPPATPIGKYATDSGLLQIRGDAQKLGSDIDSVDLIEPKISPPSLDLNINIKTSQ